MNQKIVKQAQSISRASMLCSSQTKILEMKFKDRSFGLRLKTKYLIFLCGLQNFSF